MKPGGPGASSSNRLACRGSMPGRWPRRPRGSSATLGALARLSASEVPMTPERLDAIIIGAGPAGLTAALYMGRFRRRVLVVDGGDSRAAWIPTTHNHPGFPDGVAGTALLALQRDHALRYGALIQPGTVDGLSILDDGFELALDGQTLRAATVLLACGVEDNAPDLPLVDTSVRRTLLRICPICDGFEV